MSENIIGKTLRGYEMKKELGRGGFGAVYQAHQSLLKRDVAVKVILPKYANEPDFIRRFEYEAELIARLEHPFIVPLYDFWRDPNGAFLVMRMVSGGSLRSVMENRVLSEDEVARILDQIATALHVAHRNGVVHRDIKPDNILLDADFNAYLSDFGIALEADMEANPDEDGITGSLHYIPPEQIQGASPTPQTDIYALGWVLYEMLAGVHPLEGKTTSMVIMHHLHEPTPDIGEHNQDYANYDFVIQRATAKDPAERYESTLEMAKAFRDIYSASEASFAGSDMATGEWDWNIDDEDNMVSFATEKIELPNPYKGLQAFQEADSDKFYGREALVERLLDRLTEATDLQHFLAVIGPSGSGKSSVVKAGLIPVLRDGRLPGSEEWFIVETFPGTDPFTQLETSLLSIAVNDVPNLAEALRQPEGLHAMVEALLPENSKFLLFIDQFEELFTQIEDDDLRNLYMDNLVHAFSHPDSRIRVIITLRADYYDKPLQYRNFGDVLRQRTEIVLPLSHDELAEAIQRPAESVMAVFEPGLVETIVNDVGDHPGTLPLLQYALTELFEKRMGYSLNLDTYRDIGGVTGALAGRADELYSAFDVEGQEAIRQLFLRLVNVGEGTDNTRRRVRRSELPDTPMMEEVINTYGKSRLLTFDRDPYTREGTIEVAHEAIIRRWERLVTWIDDNREILQIQGRLSSATQEWHTFDRDPAYLATGVRLVQFESLQDTDAVLNQLEIEFLRQSIDQRDEKRRIEEARKEHELQLQKQAANRLRYLVGVMVIGLLVAIVLSIWAVNGQIVAQQNEATAVAAEATAVRRQVLGDSRALAERLDEIAENDPFLAYALANDLLETVDNPPPSVVSNALATLIDTGIIHRIEVDFEEPPRVVRFTQDGSHIILGTSSGDLTLWNAETGEFVHEFNRGDNNPLVEITLIPDSNEFLTLSESENFVRLIERWSVDNSERVGIAFESLGGSIRSIEYSADGSIAIAGSGGGSSTVVNATTGEVLQNIQTNNGTILAMAVSPVGTFAATAGTDNVVTIFNYETGDILHQIPAHERIVFDVEFTPDGAYVVSSSTDGYTRIWNTLTGEKLSDLAPIRDAVFDTVVSPDGLYVLSAGQDENLLIDRVNPVSPRILSGHRDAIFSVDISPDASRVVTASLDNTVVVWAVDSSERIDRFPLNVTTSRGIDYVSNEQMLVNIDDNAVVLWDLPSNEILQRYVDDTRDDTIMYGGSMIPGRDEFLTGTEDGRMFRFDLASGALLHVYDEHDGRVWGGSPLADGQRALTGSLDRTAILWDLDSGNILQRYAGLHTDAIVSAQPSPDMSIMATASADTTIGIWNIESGELITHLTGHTRPIINVDFSPDGNRMISFALDGTILIWDTATWEIIRSLDGHRSAVMTVSFLENPRFVASVSWDETAILWDTETGDIIRRFEGSGSPMRAGVLSPDNQYLSATTWDGPVITWWINPDENSVRDWAFDTLTIPALDCDDRVTFQTPLQADCPTE